MVQNGEKEITEMNSRVYRRQQDIGHFGYSTLASSNAYPNMQPEYRQQLLNQYQRIYKIVYLGNIRKNLKLFQTLMHVI